jgi:hypothetical protein
MTQDSFVAGGRESGSRSAVGSVGFVFKKGNVLARSS